MMMHPPFVYEHKGVSIIALYNSQLMRVHDRAKCRTPLKCSIHAPKSHMRKWPYGFDGIDVTRICKHGNHHTDPDGDGAYMMDITCCMHHCCGCCYFTPKNWELVVAEHAMPSFWFT